MSVSNNMSASDKWYGDSAMYSEGPSGTNVCPSDDWHLANIERLEIDKERKVIRVEYQSGMGAGMFLDSLKCYLPNITSNHNGWSKTLEIDYREYENYDSIKIGLKNTIQEIPRHEEKPFLNEFLQ